MKEQTPEELEPRVTDNLKNNYFVEDGRLRCRGLGKNNKVKHPTNVLNLDHFFSKIIVVPQDAVKERVFVFGGTTDEGGNDPVTSCFEVQFGKKKNTLVKRADMPTARVSFACAVSQNSEHVYVVGGASGANKTPTNVCEIYSVENDSWSSIEDLCQPRFSASVIENNNELFVFGGQDTVNETAEHYNLKSIEWIDLNSENPKWEVLSEELPFASAFSGAIALHPREILIFGGWDKQTDIDNCVLLKESSPGEFSLTEADPLQDADKFLISGPRARDDQNRNIVIFGTDHVHQYNEIEKNFMTLK